MGTKCAWSPPTFTTAAIFSLGFDVIITTDATPWQMYIVGRVLEVSTKKTAIGLRQNTMGVMQTF